MSKKSIIINFFGGPGIGKSTQSADLYSIMKKKNLDVETTYEYPKLVAWEENMSAIKDQFYITANQHRNISRLYGKVKYIIVDSPIILGLIYKKLYNNGEDYPSKLYDDDFDSFLLGLFKKYENFNILLIRNNDKYDENGRLQTLAESQNIDSEIEKKLCDNNIHFDKFFVCDDTAKNIFEYIKQKYE